jgi:hypothetical protein
MVRHTTMLLAGDERKPQVVEEIVETKKIKLDNDDE